MKLLLLIKMTNVSHYNLNTFVITVKHGFFVDLVFNIGTLEIFLLLKDFSCWLSTADFERVFIACARVRFTKILNI